MRVLPRLLLIPVLFLVALPLWPLYWLGCLAWYRPPNVPRFAQAWRYLRHTWAVRPPPPGLPVVKRIGLTLSIGQKILMTPILGLAWLLDELLYGRELAEIEVRAPLFVISAGRSGSTQITRYLEADPDLAAPNLLQAMFPYLWLWRLAPRVVGRRITPDQVRARVQAMMPPELVERHEMDPFKADTFDGAFYSVHFNHLALALGPEVAVTDFNFARIAPHDQVLKTQVFVDFVDRVGRKTLLFAGPEKRFFIKGHFLYAAGALEERWPDARFLTVIREPVARLQSAINYMRVNPADPVQGPTPWPWLSRAFEQTETEYCRVEQDWFTQTGNGRRCVVRFSLFVRDLQAAMKTVYACCFDRQALPDHIPTGHPTRDRTNYTVDRSLEELGIDPAALREQLADYIAWCR